MKDKEVEKILEQFRKENGELDFQLLEQGLGKILMQVWRDTDDTETKLIIFYTMVRALNTENKITRIIDLLEQQKPTTRDTHEALERLKSTENEIKKIMGIV